MAIDDEEALHMRALSVGRGEEVRRHQRSRVTSVTGGNLGGGGFYSADSAGDLQEVFKVILSEVRSAPTSFAAPSLAVNAFIKVLRDLRIIIKNGSLTGYFLDPQSAVCSNMCATPVESSGIVLKATINTFSSLLLSLIHI